MKMENIRFSIIIGAFETNAIFFRQALASAGAIRWKNMEIHVIDACPEAGLEAVCNQVAKDDYRVSYRRVRPGNSLSGVWNDGVRNAKGDYMIFLGLTDRLNTMILRYLSDYIQSHPDDEIIYTDHDEIRDGSRMNPYFLPDFNKELLLHSNYIGDTFIVKRTAFEKTGLFNRQLVFAFAYEYFIRAMNRRVRFGHVPALLWHEMIYDIPDDSMIRSLKRKSLREHITVASAYFNQAGISASVNEGISGNSWQVRYDGSEYESGQNRVLLIREKNIRVITRHAAEILYGYVSQPDIAIAAGRFIHGTTIHNCGYIYDTDGVSYPACHGQGALSSGLYGRCAMPCDVSMVDFSYCMVDSEFYRKCGGFDTRLRGNDMILDLCLKARAGGLRTVYVPQVICHRPSAGKASDEKSRQVLRDKWKKTISAGDPCYNRNLPMGMKNYYL